MPTYTTKTKLGYWLPSGLPATITDAIKDAAIADAGSEIDAWLTQYSLGYKSNTQKFPDVNDTVPTPVIIDTCAQWIAAHNIYVILKQINKDPENKIGEILKGKADRRLDRINNGEMDIFLSDGTQITSSDTGIYHTKKYTDAPVRSGLPTFDFIQGYESEETAATEATQYSSAFVNETSVHVDHSLGYSPDVWIVDTAGNVLTADVTHDSEHKYFTVTFAEAQSGIIYWR